MLYITAFSEEDIGDVSISEGHLIGNLNFVNVDVMRNFLISLYEDVSTGRRRCLREKSEQYQIYKMLLQYFQQSEVYIFNSRFVARI